MLGNNVSFKTNKEKLSKKNTLPKKKVNSFDTLENSRCNYFTSSNKISKCINNKLIMVQIAVKSFRLSDWGKDHSLK